MESPYLPTGESDRSVRRRALVDAVAQSRSQKDTREALRRLAEFDQETKDENDRR